MRPRKKSGTIPEYKVKRRRTRAGFVPSFEEPEVELWQVWCRRTDDDSGDERRATYEDMRQAGLKPRSEK